jgi:hypothetical protein
MKDTAAADEGGRFSNVSASNKILRGANDNCESDQFQRQIS